MVCIPPGRSTEWSYVLRRKGQQDRIFQHARGALNASDEQEDAVTLKYQQIKAIYAAGLDVAHIIHRHGIESEELALQIEAAVMDAYPNLTNQAGGHGSGDYGVRHVVEVIAEYKLEPFVARERLILINISRSFQEGNKSIYDAVRGCWVIKPDKARRYGLVLAHRRGIVLGAFRPTDWLASTSLHFPWHDGDESRWGFVGEPADAETTRLYVQKRVPDQYRAKGASNPVRYVEPSAGNNS